MRTNAIQRILGTRRVFYGLMAMTLVGAGICAVAIVFEISLGIAAYLIGYGSCFTGWATVACHLARRDIRRRHTRGATRHCQSCGYNLTGLHEPRCPECGEGYGE